MGSTVLTRFCNTKAQREFVYPSETSQGEIISDGGAIVGISRGVCGALVSQSHTMVAVPRTVWGIPRGYPQSRGLVYKRYATNIGETDGMCVHRGISCSGKNE